MYIKKDKNGAWEVRLYYKTFDGTRKQKHKSGFTTKKAAQAWADDFMAQQEQRACDIVFSSFWEMYKADMKLRLRESTFRNKEYIIELKILPFFGKKKLKDITVADIRQWQSKLIAEKYSETYLRTINNQLKAIFNYAVKYYGLPSNPCLIAGSMGKGKADEMKIWTPEQFEQFLVCVKDKPQSYYAFLTLFWTGLRLGEMLALTLADVDLDKKIINVNKSLQRIGDRDVITAPKTEKGKRVITLPDFLVEELRTYTGMLYGMMDGDRVFNVNKTFLEKEMIRGCKLAGLEKIRIHDLRHSHASLLISHLSTPPHLVAKRLGHEKVQTTLEIYSHLYPNQTWELAEKLDNLITPNINEEDS